MQERSPGAGPTGRVWRELGAGGGVTVESVEVLRVDLPFLRPVTTAVGVHRHRPLVLVRVAVRTAHGRAVSGWGECAALADTTYDAEDADGAFASLTDVLVPALLASLPAGGDLPSVGHLEDAVPPGHVPLAWSTLEMAVGDAHLRAASHSLADLFGVAGRHVVPGAVLGLPTGVATLRVDLDRLAADGYARAKVKVAPGTEAIIGEVLSGRSPGGIPVQLDANGSYGPDDLEGLVGLDDLGLLCVEQPLGRDDLTGHRALAARLRTPVCLDESLDSPGRVTEAVRAGACSVVCVKPARLGGIGAALDVIDWCDAAAVPWWIGGMFEAGVGRSVLTAFGALPTAGLPGDLAPPTTYLGRDLVVPVAGGSTAGPVRITVHDGPGLAPEPDRVAVEEVLVRRHVAVR